MITVVIPAYNAVQYICRTVDSIREQSCEDWELIIVDDGSTDDTGRIIDEIALTDDRITSLHQENGGEVAARRTGVLHATGEWIMFVDADDILPNGAMESLLSTEIDADIIAGTMRVMNVANDGTILEDYVWKNRRTGLLTNIEFAEGVFLFEVQMAVWSKLYKRSLFDGFEWCLDRTIKQNPDLLMNIGIGARAKSIFVTNDAVCYNYVIHSGSASTCGLMPYIAWSALFDQAQLYINQYEVPNILNVAFSHYRLGSINGLLRHGVTVFPSNDQHIQAMLHLLPEMDLAPDEKKVIALLKSRLLRIAFNWWQKTKRFMSYIF